MPKFDASSVSDVEYDFTGWKGIKGSAYEGRTIDESGTVPEPSRQLVAQTMKRVSEAFKQTELGDVGETPDEIAKAMEKVNDEETFEKLGDELLDAISELCDGSPSRQAMEALGWRRFMAFFGYVMTELMSPEVGNAGGSNTQGKRLRSV